jgi:hypothetical protein
LVATVELEMRKKNRTRGQDAWPPIPIPHILTGMQIVGFR